MSITVFRKPTAGGGGYNLIEEDGTPLTARTTINFTGAGATATDVGGKTVVNIPGGSGGNPTYATGSFTLATGEFRVQVKRLTLTGLQRQTMQGTARMRGLS